MDTARTRKNIHLHIHVREGSTYGKWKGSYVIARDHDLLPPQGFGPEAKTRGGIIMVPAYKYLQIEISTYSMEFSLCIWKKSRFAKSGRAV